jgi:FkbM family methyltransferase
MEVRKEEIQLLKNIQSQIEIDNPLIFDVGANVGEFSKAVLDLWPKANLVAFEPNPYCWGHLAEAIGHDRIREYGLSSKKETKTMYMNGGTDLLASIYNRDLSYQGQDFGSIEFDADFELLAGQDELQKIHVAKINRDHNLDLLKIDAEGHEYDVLRGASFRISDGSIRNIYWEFNSCNLDSRTFFKDFWDLLSKSYDIYRVWPGNQVQEITKYSPELEDFVAHRDFWAKIKQ